MIKIIKLRFSKKINEFTLSKKIKLKLKLLLYYRITKILIISILFLFLAINAYKILYHKNNNINKNINDNNNLNKKNNIANFEEKIEKELSKLNYNNIKLDINNINRDFKLLVNKYKYLIKKEKNIDEKSPIWVMWYQGIDNAPPIVKSCIQSIIENRAEHPVYIISKYNLNNYIKFPPYIIKKFNKRKFSITHFSDIIRFALLSKYGGYWLDSTYFIQTPLTKVNTSFFSLKLNHCWLKRSHYIKCLYSGNFLGVGKNSFIATYAYMAFLYYWKKYNSLIYYLLIDIIIHIAYFNVPEFRNKIKKLPFVHCNIFKLERKLKNDFDISYFKCPFNKLKKRKYNILFNKKKITNFGYITEKYKLIIKNNSRNFTLNI